MSKDPVDQEERKERREAPALVAEMVNLAPPVTPAPLDHPDLTGPLDLVETSLLRWPVVLMRSLAVHRWE